MKNLIFKYLGSMQLLSFFYTIILVFMSIFLIDLTDTVRRLSVRNLLIGFEVIELSFYKTLAITQTLLSYIFLISNTVVFRKLNQTDQMTILKNLGYSIYDIVMPSLIIGAFMGMLNILCIHYFSTSVTNKYRIIEDNLFKKPPKILKTDELWIQQKQKNHNTLIYIDKIEKNILKSVIFYYFDNPVIKQILAEEAIILDNNRWLLSKVSLVMSDKKVLYQDKKILKNNLNYRHLMMYYMDPKNADIFTLLNIILLRQGTGLSTSQYWFQVNVLLIQVFFPIIMAFIAIIFSYRHYRYTIKSMSLLFIVIFGLLLHFLFQFIKNSTFNNFWYAGSICWIFCGVILSLVFFGAKVAERR